MYGIPDARIFYETLISSSSVRKPNVVMNPTVTVIRIRIVKKKMLFSCLSNCPHYNISFAANAALLATSPASVLVLLLSLADRGFALPFHEGGGGAGFERDQQKQLSSTLIFFLVLWSKSLLFQRLDLRIILYIV